MKIKLLAISICFSLIAVTHSMAAFKDPGWGARPLGMGGAYTALADDCNAQLYNPAGISQVNSFESSYMKAELFRGLDAVDLGLEYFSAVLPLNKKYKIGLLWANFITVDQYREDTFAVSLSRDIDDKISVGINAKYLYHSYTLDIRTQNDPVFASGNSKAAFTFDAGAIFDVEETANQKLSMGAAIKNITQPDVGLKTTDKVPMHIRAGAKYRFNTKKFVINPAMDITYRLQEWGTDMDKVNFHFGCEMWFAKELFGARAGGNMNELAMGLSIKPHFKMMEIQLDYGLTWPLQVEETQGSHRLALTIRFLTKSFK